jgi:hypothetical protein
VGINSRAKGARGEKLVIALVVPWWKQLEPDFEAARTPCSGGWQGRSTRGQSLRGEMKMSGDIMTTSRRFPFSCEIKNRDTWTLARIASGKPSPVWGWWRQCQTAASEAGQVPMLWIRHAREPWLVMLPYGYATRVAIRPPLLVWSPCGLLGVDVGAAHPILFDSGVVLGVHPRRFVKGAL